MTELHMKGYILQLLSENGDGLWDYDIANSTLKAYGYSGGYWKGEVRLALTDLFSCGLAESVEDKIDDGSHFQSDKLLVRYKLTDFGRERMQQTGLL